MRWLRILVAMAVIAACHALRPPTPLVVGSSPTSSFLFGKLQRAAQIAGAGLAKPKAVGNVEGRLQKTLWSKFGMSNALNSDLLDRESLSRLRSIVGTEVSSQGLDALMFLDALPDDTPPSPLENLNPFRAKAPPRPPGWIDFDALQIAASSGMQHVYIALVDGLALEQCMICLEALPSLRATVVVPEQGVAVAATRGWYSILPQDLEGELTATLQVRDGLGQIDEPIAEDAYAEPLPPLLPERPPVPGPPLAAEDLAEVLVQCALRLDRTAADGAPRLRLLRVAPLSAAAESAGLIRPDCRVAVNGLADATEFNGQLGTVLRADDNMDGSVTIGGAPGWVVKTDPKRGLPLGKIKRIRAANLEPLEPSAEWTSLLAPFGLVRARDPSDPRALVPEWGPFGARAPADVSPATFGDTGEDGFYTPP